MKIKYILFFLGVIYSQESVTLEDYQRAENFLSANTRSLVYRANVNPNWLDDGRLWYRNTVAGGTEFILVDPVKKTRKRAFNHKKLAKALSNKDTTYDALSLPFKTFKYNNLLGFHNTTIFYKQMMPLSDLSSFYLKN